MTNVNIVERLRDLARNYHRHRSHYTEAADEIERLRDELRSVRAYLQDIRQTAAERAAAGRGA